MATTTTTTTLTTPDARHQDTPIQPAASEVPNQLTSLSTPQAVRLACRSGAHSTVTAGLAPGHLQANLIVLPSKYAPDFRRLCARNPVPCPLLAESASPGDFSTLKSCVPDVLPDSAFVGRPEGGGKDFDIRTDLPQYNIYRHGKLIETGVRDLKQYWVEGDSVAFLIGCSFSFESALAAAGLPAAHTLVQPPRNVPMYRTSIPLDPAGVFTRATYVVSMRPYRREDVERVREVTARFGVTHGEPVDWGWDALDRLGIEDVDRPDWGDAALSLNPGGGLLGERKGKKGGEGDGKEEVPVFWGCGVTPQEAVMRAGERIEGVVMGHQPGHMLVLDARDGYIIS